MKLDTVEADEILYFGQGSNNIYVILDICVMQVRFAFVGKVWMLYGHLTTQQKLVLLVLCFNLDYVKGTK
jgi:hypothetical protein